MRRPTPQRPTPIRRKLINLIVLATVPLMAAGIVSTAALGTRAWRTAMADVERVSYIMHDFVRTTLRESIVSYLRAKVGTAVAMIEEWDRSDAGESGSMDAALATDLQAIPIAETGYVYVIDGNGTVVLHPDPRTEGRTLPTEQPVATQLEKRNGYLEYDWRNSWEPTDQPKALYMREYEPRGWIVAATSYRDEFVQLVERERLAQTIGAFSFNVEAYTVVVARDGTFIEHPHYAGRNMHDFLDPAEVARVTRAIFSGGGGQLRYSWPGQPGEGERPKLMFYQYLPDFDWALATTVYLDSLRAPMIRTAVLHGAGGIALMGLLIGLALRMSRSITDPIGRLADAAERSQAMSESSIGRATPQEIRALILHFNAFIDRIEHQRREVAEREQRLQRSVEEKSVLIRELHHRVKNNLQVIASLLSIQARNVSDQRDVSLFEHSRDRVISMAMVHEQLHQTGDLSMIPFNAYLRDLIAHIKEAASTESIDMTVETDPIFLELYRAVPCGLIVNELVTNALEHAFSGRPSGQVTVTFRSKADRYVLEVADDGIGMPDESSRSLGLTLVQMLSSQLDATLNVERSHGTHVRLDFPSEPRPGVA